MKTNLSSLSRGFAFTLFAMASLCLLLTGAVLADAANQTNQPLTVVQAPDGLVGWWKGQSNVMDSAGAANGYLTNGASYGPGKVGIGFCLDGISNRVVVPNATALNFGPNQNFSIEAWIQAQPTPDNYGGYTEILDKAFPRDTASTVGWLFYLHGGNLGFLMSKAPMTASAASIWETSSYNLQDGKFHHVAVTVDRDLVGKLYIDGHVVLTFDPTYQNGDLSNTAPLRIGNHNNPDLQCNFKGIIDEVSVYNSCLSESDILSLYLAAEGGKTTEPIPPTFITQPTNQTVTVGSTAQFDVVVAGREPITYNWQFNGTNITGAVSNSLVLNNVQFTNSGVYSLVVSNTNGTRISSEATLKVTTLVLEGIRGWWKGESNALDSVGEANGCITNGVTYVPAVVGAGFSFDGVDDRLIIPSTPVINFGSNQNFSIETWIQAQPTPDNNYGITIIADKASRDDTDHTAGWQMYLEQGRLGFQLLQGPLSSESHWTSAGPDLQDGMFHHVAATVNRSSPNGGNLYVDGVLRLTFDPTYKSGDLSSDAPLFIGSHGELSLNCFFKGIIDEFSVFDRELTSSEIFSIYKANQAGKELMPSAPVIIAQPKDQRIIAGTAAKIEVAVIGTQPLSYQWCFNGTNIAGATNNPLILTNIQSSNEGLYSLIISNGIGSVTSSNALVTLKHSIPAPQGLVGWWKGESNVFDFAGNAEGYLTNGTGYGPGMVGNGFNMDGISNRVVVPNATALNFGSNQNFSVEVWIQAQPTPGNYGGYAEILDKADPQNASTTVGWLFYLHSGKLGLVMSKAPATSGSSSTWEASYPNLQDGKLHHVAVTVDRDSTDGGKLYVDGNIVLTFDPTYQNGDLSNSAPLRIGNHNYPGFSCNFKGIIDEASVYNRALSSAEIGIIYDSSSVGKTMEPTAPVIITQPASQQIVQGRNATLDVGVLGTQPLSYQWCFNGTNIDRATNKTFTLSNFQVANEGTYAVAVSNSMGSATSSNAVLTMKVPITAPDGLIGWWSAEGNVLDNYSKSIGYLTCGAGYGPGEVGTGFSFGGTNDYAVVPDASWLNFGTNQNFSVEAWIQAPNNYSYQTYRVISPIVAKTSSASASASLGWMLYMQYGCLGFQMSQAPLASGNVSKWLSSSLNLMDGKFHHVAATLNRNSATGGKLYVDGNLVKTFNPATENGDLSTAGPLYIGSLDTNGVYPSFKGVVDELSLYNRELNSNEIVTLYQACDAGKALKPFAPVVLTQPVNQTIAQGLNVLFDVSATGTEQLNYQWSFNGTNIVNATNKSLALANVQLSDAGVYAVVITNALGSVTSSNATLTVVPPITAAQGLVGWWRGESNVVDEFTGSTGYLTNGASYGSGEVGTGFRITGLNAQVIVPNAPELNFGSGQNFSVESWLKISSTPGRYNGLTYIADKSSGSDEVNRVGWRLLASSDNLWFIMSQSPLTNGSWSIWTATNVGILDGRFHHVAATVNRTSKTGGSIYVDGHLIMSFDPTSQCGDLSNNGPLRIGNSDDMHDTGEFDGIIDEVTVYNRALASNEIAAISQAGVGGKNLEPSAPIIVQQPSSQRIVQGNDVTFQVGAGGTQPLGFQWLFNGANIAGGTNSWLTLTNIQFAQAGAYSVQITNILGTVMSSNATLRVDYPPATVLIANVTGSASAPITVPVLLQANGNENAVSFSVNFDPTVLAYANVGIGSGATRGSLFINTNLVASGKLGVILALPSGSVFSAGTQEVVSVAFNITTTQAGSSAVTLGNQPTLSQLSDVEASILAANYAGATVTIAAADFEGDVTPRPNGDKNVTLTDWVQEGRYVARLDNPAGASEYQRADCAPQSTRGDGAITVLDWVQAGRYAVGLDRLVPVGGPTADIVPIEPLDNHSSLITESTSGCEVKIVEMSLVQGRSGTVSVVMEAQGTENAAGFSLAFDPTTISFLNASLGSAATGAMVNVNTNDVASGHVGFALALSPGQTFGTGTKEILKLSVQVAASAATGQSLFTFTDVPVTKVVSDTTAMAVNATFTQGVVDVSSSIPALRISRLSDQVVLAWPDWATNYVLQISGNAGANLNWTNSVAPSTLTNSEYVVALPVSAEAQFYRLIQSGIQNILMTPASTGSTNTTIIKK